MATLVPISDADGSWAALKAAWRTECEGYGEDFESYAVGTFSALDPLAAEGHPRAEIYAVQGQNGHFPAICQINRTPLPGYDGPVMRVRFMTFSPKYDFGDLDIEDYAALLVGLFSGVMQLSAQGDLVSKYLKFHLKSPADRQFFAALGVQVEGKVSLWEAFKVTGSWLYVTKA